MNKYGEKSPDFFENYLSLLPSSINNMLSVQGVCDAVVTVDFIILVQKLFLNDRFVEN